LPLQQSPAAAASATSRAGLADTAPNEHDAMMTSVESAIAETTVDDASAPVEPTPLDAPPDPSLDALALFVDVDGTLVDLALRPDAVVVEPSLPPTLKTLHAKLGGALAPVSGRPLAGIDALLDLSGAAAAGLHGAELRGPDGTLLAMPSAHPGLDAARRRAIAAASDIPGVLVEDKNAAIALHYRTAPDAEVEVRAVASAMLDLAGTDYELLQGKFVIELKPRAADKGTALAALMKLPPFAGRTPYMLGDDATDEDAFAQANALGGVSVIVGVRRPTLARYALKGPAAAREWIAHLAAQPTGAAR
jgi:trehalose 6-phosphate phosphatase